MGSSSSKVDTEPVYGYTGEYNPQGQKHGHGTFNYPSGSVYEGSWIEDLKEGQGKFVAASGNV